MHAWLTTAGSVAGMRTGIQASTLSMLWNDIWEILVLQCSQNVVENHQCHFISAVPSPEGSAIVARLTLTQSPYEAAE